MHLLVILILTLAFFNPLTSAFGQDQTTAIQKRLTNLRSFQTEFNQYSEITNPDGKKAATEFQKFLDSSIPELVSCPKDQNCLQKSKLYHTQARRFINLIRAYQINEKTPNVCSKANVGVGKDLKARGIDASGVITESELEVYVCNDKTGAKLVKVSDGSAKLLNLAPEYAKKPELQPSILPPEENILTLRKKLNLTQSSASISASPNPCTIPAGQTTCPEVVVEWDVSDDTPDPVQLKDTSGKVIETSRNAREKFKDITIQGKVLNLFANDQQIGTIELKGVK